MAKAIQLPTTVDNHLGPDTLAAFVEQALPDCEVTAVFAHLADCEHCRERVRVQAQLRNLDGTEIPVASQRPAWFTALPFRTAAGFVCAVLSGAVLLLWSHSPQEPVRLTTNTSSLPVKSLSVQRASLSTDGFRSHERGTFSEATSALSKKNNLTSDITSDKQTRSRRAERPRPLGGTVASHFVFRSETAPASLPGPFAAARLNQMNFGTASLNEEEESRIQGGYSIAIRTSLGERRFYWSSLVNESRVDQ